MWVFVVPTLTSNGLQLPGWRRDLHVGRTSLAPQQQQLVQPRTLLCYRGATGEKRPSQASRRSPNSSGGKRRDQTPVAGIRRRQVFPRTCQRTRASPFSPEKREVFLKVESEEEFSGSGCRTETKGSGGHSRRSGEWHMLQPPR